MTSRKGVTKLLLSAVAILFSANVMAQTELNVTRITPAGDDVSAANQVLINFNKPVVPLGDSRRSADQVPVRITPKLNCQWQWISAKQLACQLNREDKLKLATKYKIVVGTKALNENGDALTKPHQHVIRTRRPSASYTSFAEIEQRGFPVFYVHFNQEVSKRSAARLIKFEYQLNGKAKQINARVLTRLPSQKNDKAYYSPIKDNAKYSRLWLVQPARALPKASKIRLHAKAGLKSKEGSLKSLEDKTLKSFFSFDDFRFVGLSCANSEFKNKFYSYEQLDRAKCNPQAQVQLAFSSPFNAKQFAKYFDFTQAGEPSDLLDKAWQSGYQPYIRPASSAKQYYYLRLPNGLVPSENIELRAKRSESPLAMPKDLFGQALDQHLDLKFKTRNFSPKVSLPENYVVLEQGVESDAPVELTNLDSLSFNFELANGEKGQRDFDLGFGLNQVATMPIGARELLDGKSGYLIGHFVASPQSADHLNRSRQDRLHAQVTPYQVHAKLGSFSSLAWVTELANGKLVDSAKVELITSTTRSHPEQEALVLHTAVTNAKGVALLPGTAELRSTMQSHCEEIYCGDLWLRVTKGRGVKSAKAMLLLDDEFAVELGTVTDYELYSDPREPYGHLQAWGTTAQGLYRPGDTINYKIYVRDQNLKGLTAAPKKSYSLVVEDDYGNSILEREAIVLDRYGSISGEIVLAATATMGEYTFELRSDFTDEEWRPLSVQVTDFTPAPFKLSQILNGSTFTAGQKLVVDVQAELYAGGPYTDAEADFELISMPVRFDPQTEATKGYEFSNYEGYQRDSLLFKQVDLDVQGQAQVSFELPKLESGVVSADIVAQTLMEDERGKAIVSRSRASYLAFDRLVGLKAQKWVYQVGQQVALDTIVINPEGALIKDTEINIRIDRESSEGNDAHDFEDDSTQEDWVEVSRCNLTSTLTKSECKFTAKHAGRHRATATIKDTQGREHSLRYWVWVSGNDVSHWNNDSPYKLELVAEKSSFSVGETARFMVKNPFPGARALITIERHGILESWQQRLHGSAPVIEFEMKPNYAPGAYLSVVVTKPRTGNTVPKQGEVDLDKPAFKMGYKKLTVSNPSNPLKLVISSDSEVYKPGGTVRLTVRPEFPELLDGQEIEFSISVLDESVLDLVQGGSDYFDPILGFNKLENLDLQNFNLLTKLLGLLPFSEPQTDEQVKQVLMNQSSAMAFQAQSLRLRAPVSRVEENFALSYASSDSAVLEEVIVTGAKKIDTNLGDEPPQITARDNLVDNALWKDHVSIHDDGSATIEFVVPDNLTAWRVLAVAATATDKFSLSEHSFKVNQLTEIRPVMPNQVTETDTFNAGFSVLNRSDQARSIEVSIDSSGSVEGRAISFKQTLELAAHARQIVYFPNTAIRLASGQHQGLIEYMIVAGDAADKDALRHSLEVNKQSNITTVAAYGSISAELSEEHLAGGPKEIIEQAIKFPENIAGDRGGLKITLSPSIISNVGGAFEYMKNYPYACWEQKLSTAVMASHHQRLGQYLSDDFSWEESKTLPQQTLDIAAQSQAPNGGMTYFRAEDAFVSPYLSAYTALAFTWLDEAGYKVPSQVQENLHEYLNSFLDAKKDANSLSNNATATLHAIAIAALAKTGDVSRAQLLKAYVDHDVMSLFGKAQLLNALANFENTQTQQATLLDKILSQSNSSAGKIVFSEARDSSYARLHSSDSRSSCAILDTLLASESSLSDQQLTSKLVRSIVAKRGTRSHWENTQDNVYCLNAISNYAQSFETQVPDLSAKVTLDESVIGEARLSDFKASADSIELAMQPEFVGKAKTLSIERDGKGRLYYQTQLSFNKLEPQSQRENAGFDIRRERSVFRDKQWQHLKSGDQVKRGETVRTDLFLSTPVERSFVAVRDPLPGGLEPVNFDLATNGLSLEMQEAQPFFPSSYYYQYGAWKGLSYNPSGFYHKQLGHDAVTFYSDYVYEGNYHLSYYAQAIATGDFVEQPVHAEEMYDPDIYGKGLSGSLKVVD